MMHISFWGSPEISVILLEELVKNPGIQVEFVVTQEDKPRSYRGKLEEPTPVKKKADHYNIPVFTPKSLKKNSDELFAQISQFSVDLNVVFAYGKIIPERFFNLPRLGSLNFHASLLPNLRGASPIEHALLQGDEKTGWTMQKMNAELDAGDMYYIHEVEIKWEDDYNSLTQRLMTELISFSGNILEQYTSGKLVPVHQKNEMATHCGKIDTDQGKINWFDSVFNVRNRARAMSNRGGIYSFLNTKKYKIFPDLQIDRETILKSSEFAKQPGIIAMATDQHIWISCNNNQSLPVKYIQPEGKKKLTPREFINGYRIQIGDRFDVFAG